MKDEWRAMKRELLAWYDAPFGARAPKDKSGTAPLTREARELPWRRTQDPYAIWVSETMLQQTRAATVIPYFERFVRELPTVQSLAEAPEERVLALWSGLGYYRRARMLRAAAKQVALLYDGHVPADVRALEALDGVGPYTAGAVASIAFKARVPAVDGNVERVLARLFAVEDDVKAAAGKARIAELAGRLAAIDEGDAGDWTQALMELGATVCTPGAPRCRACPLRSRCKAFGRGIASELPRKSPRRARPKVVRSVAIVLASRSAVLLARRRSDALFGGLWEPPQSAPAAAKKLAACLRVDPGALTDAGEIVHVLSHRRMHVQVLRGALKLGRRHALEGWWAAALPGAEYAAVEVVPFAELRGSHTRPYGSLTPKVLDMANVPWRGLL
jgi:A/G-specific adenine glycosylase